ncbi:putative inner membrane transporter yiJE [mine drainage metagenome]|uniref:Putative inner membrane transporter yiJE n=1 Tax=mine drainage metagenome TaxID=410659 RepID=A0A1J5QZ85_9ZZZZ
MSDSRLPLDGRAIVTMVALCVVWSLQQISLKAIEVDVAPALMIGLRSGIAALCVAALMRARGQRVTLASGRWRAGAVVGTLFAFEYLLVAEALRLSYASHVVVFLYTAPIFAAVGLHARLPAERLQALQWTGIAVAFGGIVVAFLGRAQPTTAAAPNLLLGDALALAAGATWGATTVTIRCSALSSAPPAETLLYQLLGAFVLLLPAAWLSGQWRFTPTTLAWAHLAFQALIVSFASFLLWFWLLRHYLASRLSVFSFLTPIFGVVFGIWLLGEPAQPTFLAGSALVLGGIVLVSAHGRLRPPGAARLRT